MDKGTSFSEKLKVKYGGNFSTDEQPLVMGVINLTPDSFYDGNRYNSTENALNQADRLVKEGADILDLGAVSTRPGAADVSKQEELKRLIPTLESIIKKHPQIPVSVDTYRTETAKQSLNSGADIINDISGGTFDKNMIPTVEKFRTTYVLMHIKGKPDNMQINPQYDDVVEEIKGFFNKQLSLFQNIKKTDIILDPGFGFGKTLENNYSLLKRLEEFKSFGYPVLAGVSRKSMINKVLGTKPENALNGTTVVNTMALMHGAKILRVHDVKEAVEAVKLFKAYKEAGSGHYPTTVCQ